MYEKEIRCSNCKRKFPRDKLIFRCECGGNLEIVFDCAKLRKVKYDLQKRPFRQDRYKEFYPVSERVSLQEGGTSLLRSKNIEKMYNLSFELYFKNESLNPTGSFKDRGSSVEVAKARECRKKQAICASTGNMGASVAAYSGIAGIRCTVVIPQDGTQGKVEQIHAHGANVYRAKGSYAQAAALAEAAWKEKGWFLFGDYLYRREGTKSIGFELAEQGVFDYVCCPVGNGVLTSATWKGFREFREIGMVKKLPRMVGIQSKGCNPLYRAYISKSPIHPLKNPKTVANAIECGDPLDGANALKAVMESKGFAKEVTDKEILRVQDILARKEGLFAEPAGAAAVAGALKYKEEMEKGSRVVCVITGHGLKTLFIKHKKPLNINGLRALR